jgi:MoaA/NifB/PqqE/SkfB family radical SAM enzyme
MGLSFMEPQTAEIDLLAEYAPADLPRVAWIELTSTCPFRCIFCSRQLRRGPGEHMPFETYCSLIRQLDRPSVVQLNYSGESIHYPRLADAIRAAKSTGAETELVTALATASEETLLGIVEAGLDRLTISLHTLQPEQFEEIYGQSSLKDMRDRVARLIRIREDLHSRLPRLELAFVATARNLPELSPIAIYARQIGVKDIVVYPVLRRDPLPLPFDEELKDGEHTPPFLENVRQAVRLAHHVNRELRIRIYEGERRPDHLLGRMPQPWAEPLPSGARIRTCDQNPWDTIHVLADGTVVTCETRDGIPMGNVHEESLRDIWHGRRYRELRRQYLEGSLQDCARCHWKTAHLPAPLQRSIASGEAPSPQLFRGWHEPDSCGTIWSDREAVVVLGGSDVADSVAISGVLPPSTDEADNWLEVSCNGANIGRIVNPTVAPITFSTCLGGIPHRGEPLVFQLKTRTALNPARAGLSGDARDLGFALFRIAV